MVGRRSFIKVVAIAFALAGCYNVSTEDDEAFAVETEVGSSSDALSAKQCASKAKTCDAYLTNCHTAYHGKMKVAQMIRDKCLGVSDDANASANCSAIYDKTTKKAYVDKNTCVLKAVSTEACNTCTASCASESLKCEKLADWYSDSSGNKPGPYDNFGSYY